MTFNIGKFISDIEKNGVQFNSDYDVIIPVPEVMLGKYQKKTDKPDITFIEQSKLLNMRAVSISQPGVALRTVLSNRHGPGVFEKMPYSAGFTNINVTFLADKDSNIAHFWYSWLNMITNFADTNELFGGNFKQYVVNYKDHFISNISLNKYDKGGNKTSTIILRNAFPLSINENNLSWNDQNVSTVTISLEFKDWYYEGSTIKLTEKDTQ